MKVVVDIEACLLHGQCVIAAPNVFSFADDGQLLWVADPDEALRAEADAAADACPEQAIVIE